MAGPHIIEFFRGQLLRSEREGIQYRRETLDKIEECFNLIQRGASAERWVRYLLDGEVDESTFMAWASLAGSKTSTSGVDDMPQSAHDKYARVQQMIIDDGGLWDLSHDDKEALRHVLGLVNVLADEIAKDDGTTVPGVLKKFGDVVEIGD